MPVIHDFLGPVFTTVASVVLACTNSAVSRSMPASPTPEPAARFVLVGLTNGPALHPNPWPGRPAQQLLRANFAPPR